MVVVRDNSRQPVSRTRELSALTQALLERTALAFTRNSSTRNSTTAFE